MLSKPATDEDSLVDYLSLRGFTVKQAGNRFQRFDLEITEPSRWVLGIYDGVAVPQIPVGKYEVKSLYRRKPTHAWDRRFKTGSRGETIYGRRDAEIKSLALDIEAYVDSAVWNGGVKDIDSIHSLIDDALARRHSKSFMEKFTLLAEAYDDQYLLSSAGRFLDGKIGADDIVGGFSDIDGIFVIADNMYTLVSRAEYGHFICFDSVSVEGVKLRYEGDIPTNKV